MKTEMIIMAAGALLVMLVTGPSFLGGVRSGDEPFTAYAPSETTE
jgi:hypothetical protein